MRGGSNHSFSLDLPAPSPDLCRARVRVFTPMSEAQDCRFFVFVQFPPADALLSPEPGGDQGTLFAHNVVQGYICGCVLPFIYFCVVFVLLVSADHSPPSRGCRWCHLPFRVFVVSSSNPHHANGPREVFGVTSPLY